MRHTTVADVMSTNVISAVPQDSFAQLTTLLRGAAIRAVPVVDAEAHCWASSPRPTSWPRQPAPTDGSAAVVASSAHPPPGPGVEGGRDQQRPSS